MTYACHSTVHFHCLDKINLPLSRLAARLFHFDEYSPPIGAAHPEEIGEPGRKPRAEIPAVLRISSPHIAAKYHSVWSEGNSDLVLNFMFRQKSSPFSLPDNKPSRACTHAS